MSLVFENGFNLLPEGEEAGREDAVVGVELNGKVVWIGKSLESADFAIAYNDKTIQNIWGETLDKSTVGALTMTLDPFNIIGTGGEESTSDGLGAFQAQLLEAALSRDLTGMKAPAIVAFAFAGAEGKYRAKRYAESTWKPQSFGGTGADQTLKFPINVTFAGTEAVGTVDKLPPANLTAEFTEVQ